MRAQFKVRMAWTFAGCEDSHGRYPIAEALRAAGLGEEAIAKMYATLLMHLAEVEIGEDGTMKILSIRPIEQCRSVHESGDRCYKQEEHGREHESRTAIPGGMATRLWKD